MTCQIVQYFSISCWFIGAVFFYMSAYFYKKTSKKLEKEWEDRFQTLNDWHAALEREEKRLMNLSRKS